MQRRSQVLSQIENREFDLLIIGGGVVGVGVAQDAASRGLSVLLVEKADFASGTSSRTNKLIHGGLRQLEPFQFQFRLTRELCRERDLLEQLAPHMVRDFSFLLPISRGKTFFGLKAELGLTLYDLLSINARAVRRHERLSRKAALKAAPSLSEQVVQAALRFHDCITDDARIVMEVLKSAVGLGALAINYVEAKEFETEDGKIKSVRCQDRISGNTIEVNCKACVNASGVWSDKLFKQIDPSWLNRVATAKGTHIMLPLSAFETNTALYLPTQDGRYVFVVPWQKALMVGTTDSPYDGPLDNPQPTEEEITYLLSVLNSYSKKGRTLARSDVIAAWSGLRPLISESGASDATKNLSREHLLFTGPAGIIGLLGGKLTNYLTLSMQIVDRAIEQLKKREPDLGTRLKAPQTGRIMLGGWQNKDDYLTSSAQISSYGRKLGLDPATIEHLSATYGKDALKIMETAEAEPKLKERICPDFPPLMAEVPFVTENEMAESLEDILSRRIRLAFLHHKQCLEAAPKVARLVAEAQGWDNTRIAGEIANLELIFGPQLAPAL